MLEHYDLTQLFVPSQNIRRRVYDALNVLNAIDIISFDNKDIRWVGIDQSSVIHEVTECQTAMALAQGGDPPEDGGDDESEEPEDDDMEIEKLQVKMCDLKHGFFLEPQYSIGHED